MDSKMNGLLCGKPKRVEAAIMRANIDGAIGYHCRGVDDVSGREAPFFEAGGSIDGVETVVKPASINDAARYRWWGDGIEVTSGEAPFLFPGEGVDGVE